MSVGERKIHETWWQFQYVVWWWWLVEAIFLVGEFFLPIHCSFHLYFSWVAMVIGKHLNERESFVDHCLCFGAIELKQEFENWCFGFQT